MIDNEPYFWILDGRSNRQLQVFFFLNKWVGMSEDQKITWLRFAQQGDVQSSTLKDIQGDEVEWTVTKRIDECLVVATKRFRINGLSDILPTIPKKP